MNVNNTANRPRISFQSLKDITAKREEEKVRQDLLAKLQDCQTVLTKRTATEIEVEDFFRSKKINNQTDLLREFENAPEEVAAYYVSKNTTLKINRFKVFNWLVSHADSLSEDAFKTLVDDSHNWQLLVTVGEYDYPVNRLNAALCARFFRENLKGCKLDGVSEDHFEKVANWINDRTNPQLASLPENEFRQFQDLLLRLGVEDELIVDVVQEYIRRYQLSFNVSALKLGPDDGEKFTKLHPLFLQTISSIELQSAGLLSLLKDLNFKLITIHETENLNLSLLRDFKCKFDFVGPFPKGVGKVTSNLVNFVIQEEGDWEALQKQAHLERVVVKNLPMDNRRLNYLAGLKSIRLDTAPLGEAQVIQLCERNPDLESLILPHSWCGKDGFSTLASLKSLKELHIGSKGLDFNYRVMLPKRNNFKSFRDESGFKKLEKLILSNGSFTGKEMKDLCSLPNLKEVDISKCVIDNILSIVHLSLMSDHASVLISCIGRNRENFDNYLQRYVSSKAKITVAGGDCVE